MRSGKSRLLLCEGLILLCLVALSAITSPQSPGFRWSGMGSGNGLALFTLLFLLTLNTAWHEVLAEASYWQMRPRMRRFYEQPRLFVAQSLVVATYGLLIIFVASLEVLTHSIYVSWAIGFRAAASILLLFFLWHSIAVPNASATQSPDRGADEGPAPSSAHSAAATTLPSHAKTWCKRFALLFLLLLPQSLMFYTRVLFLLATEDQGGLSCSLQELGYAHGVVGAIAFGLGAFLSQRFKTHKHLKHPHYPQQHVTKKTQSTSHWCPPLSCICLTLSPLVYLALSLNHPDTLWMLSLSTFAAQLLFGFGLHRTLSHFALPAFIGLRVPLVALAMFLPMALSGWMVSQMSFTQFFLVDSLCALLPLSLMLWQHHNRR